MDIEDIRLAADLDERFRQLALLTQNILEDDELPIELRRSFAAETLRLTYLQGYVDRMRGMDLP